MTSVLNDLRAPAQFGNAVDLLHEQAAALSELEDFGPLDYLPGLRILLRSIDSDLLASATRAGRELAWSTLRMTLASRTYAVKGWSREPAVLKHAIEAPVVVVGVPRTGTTALHKLLAIDPQFQGLEHWLAMAPMPRPARQEWLENAGYQRAKQLLSAMFDSSPEFRSAHNIVVDEVDECLVVLAQSFVSNRWACSWKAPSYDAWWQTQSERSSYAWYADVLRLIGSNTHHVTWLLKNPGHIANLDLLFETFPDARVVQTHRHPAKAVPSISSTLLMAHRMCEGDRANDWAKILGPREMEKWAAALRAAKPIRELHRNQVFDMDYRRFVRDPLSIVGELYDHFGLRLTEDVESRMAERIAQSPERSHGVHSYDLESFGLSIPEIESRFYDYLREFDLAEPA